MAHSQQTHEPNFLKKTKSSRAPIPFKKTSSKKYLLSRHSATPRRIQGSKHLHLHASDASEKTARGRDQGLCQVSTLACARAGWFSLARSERTASWRDTTRRAGVSARSGHAEDTPGRPTRPDGFLSPRGGVSGDPREEVGTLVSAKSHAFGSAFPPCPARGVEVATRLMNERIDTHKRASRGSASSWKDTGTP
jgi:hypothetical protein